MGVMPYYSSEIIIISAFRRYKTSLYRYFTGKGNMNKKQSFSIKIKDKTSPKLWSEIYSLSRVAFSTLIKMEKCAMPNESEFYYCKILIKITLIKISTGVN